MRDADVTKLGTAPEVAAWSGFALGPGEIAGLPGAGLFMTVGDGWWNTIERAKVLEGRLPDPSRDDEMVINEPARKFGLRVGQTWTDHEYSPADLSAAGRDGPPLPLDQLHGPVVKMKIVGIVRMPMDSVLTFAASEPEIYPSPGFYARHHEEMATFFTNAFFRLRHGAADFPAFQAHVAQVYGRSDIPVKDQSDDVKRVQNSTDVEHSALLLFAAAAALASLVLVG